jgi:hypothetical protein
MIIHLDVSSTTLLLILKYYIINIKFVILLLRINLLFKGIFLLQEKSASMGFYYSVFKTYITDISDLL